MSTLTKINWIYGGVIKLTLRRFDKRFPYHNNTDQIHVALYGEKIDRVQIFIHGMAINIKPWVQSDVIRR